MHEILNPNYDTFFVNIGPMSNTTHEGEVPAGDMMRTGQPLIVYKADMAELRDIVFMSHEDDSGVASVLYPIDFSIYYDLESLEEVKRDINSFDFVKVTEFKHPNRDEWALAVQEMCIQAMPSGDVKDRILAAAALSISENRRKTLDEMLVDGWSPYATRYNIFDESRADHSFSVVIGDPTLASNSDREYLVTSSSDPSILQVESGAYPASDGNTARVYLDKQEVVPPAVEGDWLLLESTVPVSGDGRIVVEAKMLNTNADSIDIIVFNDTLSERRSISSGITSVDLSLGKITQGSRVSIAIENTGNQVIDLTSWIEAYITVIHN